MENRIDREPICVRSLKQVRIFTQEVEGDPILSNSKELVIIGMNVVSWCPLVVARPMHRDVEDRVPHRFFAQLKSC